MCYNLRLLEDARMTENDILVAKVLMPERGVFAVRVDEPLVISGDVKSGMAGRFVVALDYGEDVGRAFCIEAYDPEMHGERIPGFRLLRTLDARDEKTLSENETLAAAMRNEIGRAHV